MFSYIVCIGGYINGAAGAYKIDQSIVWGEFTQIEKSEQTAKRVPGTCVVVAAGGRWRQIPLFDSQDLPHWAEMKILWKCTVANLLTGNSELDTASQV